MLDEQDGQTERGPDRGDDVGGAGPFGGVHAGHGFVEEQDAGLQAEGAGEFDAFAVAVGEVGDGGVEVRPQAHEFGEFPGPLPVRALLAPGGGQPQRGGGVPGAGQRVPAEHEVVGDGGPGGDEVLERARQAERGDPVRGEPGEFRVAEQYPPGVRPAQSRQNVEAGRLPGPVGPDQRVHGARRDGEGDPVERGQPGEPHGDVAQAERRGRTGGPGGRRPAAVVDAHAAPCPPAAASGVPSAGSPR